MALPLNLTREDLRPRYKGTPAADVRLPMFKIKPRDVACASRVVFADEGNGRFVLKTGPAPTTTREPVPPSVWP